MCQSWEFMIPANRTIDSFAIGGELTEKVGTLISRVLIVLRFAPRRALLGSFTECGACCGIINRQPVEQPCDDCIEQRQVVPRPQPLVPVVELGFVEGR